MKIPKNLLLLAGACLCTAALTLIPAYADDADAASQISLEEEVELEEAPTVQPRSTRTGMKRKVVRSLPWVAGIALLATLAIIAGTLIYKRRGSQSSSTPPSSRRPSQASIASTESQRRNSPTPPNTVNPTNPPPPQNTEEPKQPSRQPTPEPPKEDQTNSGGAQTTDETDKGGDEPKKEDASS